ncbi:alpha/beta fold hydrolase [Ktedonosporobacter rubrisoli]|uniref:Alpha/beta fold hydrolase n=1 Tax=Ktedonosporobacter rubrisoli TaxID=2509675 RepID=A0A4P6JKL0_KTERU|nr:alpha/beta fold hydrolase [Ktedonosporobacter rubrisoli]QBD75727.1 alpha/beta fold hydrolase [Ktedonosporobacter rubrisoli]
MPYATASDGIRLYYEEVGTGEPLLLVSGKGSDHTSWSIVRDDFAHSYHVIVYDHRGTGQSDKPSEPPYTISGLAQDAIAILDHLNIQRAHAYGVSMGGKICQCLGIEHAERIGALVLGCTTSGNAHGVPRSPEVSAMMASPSIDTQFELMLSPTWVAAHSELIASYVSQQSPLPAYVQNLHSQASEGYDSWDQLPTIKAPTLVIHGSEDRVVQAANAYLLADRIPNAELYIVQGGRHGYYLEFREEASRVVNEFLARHPL